MSDIKQILSDAETSDSFTALKNFYNRKTIWDIIGVSRDENKHTEFLAWLFDPTESHVLGNFAIEQLLILISKALELPLNQKALRADNRWFGEWITRAEYKELSDIRVVTQKSEKRSGFGKSFYDILITGKIKLSDATPWKKLKILIENKVGSSENFDNDGKGQTEKYKENFQKARNEAKEQEETLMLFLTPMSSIEYSNRQEQECTCTDFIQINYQMILDGILYPALYRITKGQEKFNLKEYIKTLSHLSARNQPIQQEEAEINNKREVQIMAITSEERELIKNFVKKNQALINAIADANTFDEQLQQNSEVSKVGNILRTQVRRGDTEIKIPGMNTNGWSLKNLVEFLIQEANKIDTDANTDRLSKWGVESNRHYSGNLPLFLNVNTYTEKKHKTRYDLHNSIIIKGETFYICTQWNTPKFKGRQKGNMDNTIKFINDIMKEFPELKEKYNIEITKTFKDGSPSLTWDFPQPEY